MEEEDSIKAANAKMKKKSIGDENDDDDFADDDDDFQGFQGDEPDSTKESKDDQKLDKDDFNADDDDDDGFDDDADFQKFEDVKNDAADAMKSDAGMNGASATAATPRLDWDVGEGGAGGDEMEAGKSVVFATLEVCLCALLRQIPALNPQAPQTG